MLYRPDGPGARLSESASAAASSMHPTERRRARVWKPGVCRLRLRTPRFRAPSERAAIGRRTRTGGQASSALATNRIPLPCRAVAGLPADAAASPMRPAERRQARVCGNLASAGFAAVVPPAASSSTALPSLRPATALDTQKRACTLTAVLLAPLRRKRRPRPSRALC